MVRFGVFACMLGYSYSLNAVEKVVELLGELKTQVQNDMAGEEKLSQEYFEWAEKTEWEKNRDIEDGEREASSLSAVIEEVSVDVAAQGSEIEKLSNAIAASEADLKKATEIRGEEVKTFGKEEAEMEEAISTLERAVVVIKKHFADAEKNDAVKSEVALLSTFFTKLIQGSWVTSRSRKAVKSLMQEDSNDIDFQNPTANPYENRSGGIIATLTNLQDEAETALNDLRRTEMETQHNFEMLKQSIENEVEVRHKALREAQSSKSNAEERRSRATKELVSVSKTLEEDKKFRGELLQTWETRKADHEASQQSFKDEVSAIEEAISILTNEEFTGAMGRQSGTLIQMRSDTTRIHVETARALRQLGLKFNSSELMQLSARAKADPFGKVKNMIAEMIARLEKQAVEEADHKMWCDQETKATKEKISARNAELEKYDTRLAQYVANVETLTQAVHRLEKEIANMDASMAEANKLRTDESAKFKVTKADCEMSVSALQQAIQVLQAYYENGTAPTTPPGLMQEKTYKPRTFGANKGASTGIIGMLETTEADFSRMLAEATATEDESDAGYRKMKNEYEVSKATKLAEVSGKTQEIKGAKHGKNNAENDREGVQTELDALVEYKAKVDEQCTYKVPTFEERAARRKAEIEGLKNALQILSREQVATLKDSGTALMQTHLRSVSRHRAA